MMLGLMIWMSTPVASISRSRNGSSVMRWNSGSGTPFPPATARAYCECSKVRFITSGTSTWARTSTTIGLGEGPLDRASFVAPRAGLAYRERPLDRRACRLRRFVAFAIASSVFVGAHRALFRRNDRHQQEGFPITAGIDRVFPDIVVGVIVRVRRAADAVARLNVEADAMAAFEHHRGRPNLHLHLDDLVRLEPLPPQMLVVGAIGKRQFAVELAM